MTICMPGNPLIIFPGVRHPLYARPCQVRSSILIHVSRRPAGQWLSGEIGQWAGASNLAADTPYLEGLVDETRSSLKVGDFRLLHEGVGIRI